MTDIFHQEAEKRKAQEIADEGKKAAERKAQEIANEGKKLASWIRDDDNVGDLLSLSYDSATILVHDNLRQKVNGLPMGCFLLATRITPEADVNPTHEDTAVLLLRVLSNARLYNQADMEKYILEAGFRAIGDNVTWDTTGKTDQITLNQLRHAGVLCSVLGTFRKRETNGKWHTVFCADISNFYAGRGMKIYKPVGETLTQIANYSLNPTDSPVSVGRIRYCASEIKEGTAPENVNVNMVLDDLIARRTALFGMSRSGKSNTIKIIASSIFQLREHNSNKRKIGQLIFDVNGEYCNLNWQDQGCLRSIGRQEKDPDKSNVVTYGLFKHPRDPYRNLLTTNFMGKNISHWNDRKEVEDALVMLINGKEIIDEKLLASDSNYVVEFRNTSLKMPDQWGYGEQKRYRRVIEIYRAILCRAKFKPSQNTVNIDGLFNDKLCDAMETMGEKYPSAKTLREKQVSWDAFYAAVADLAKYIKAQRPQNDTNNKKTYFNDFDKGYRDGPDGKSWADNTLRGILSMFDATGGMRLIGSAVQQHSPSAQHDYPGQIVEHVQKGKLVIVDQSTGSPDLRQITAKRIMEKLFEEQKQNFIDPKTFIDPETGDKEIVQPPDVIVYIEEAHNLLPAKPTEAELRSIWARTAKEGSKFCIGMIYSTQEPSSILPNILKNTDNWFVAYLNNTDEIREVKKYYDFEAFAGQILKVQEIGFLRMRCLSNPYTIPIQVNKFDYREIKQERETQQESEAQQEEETHALSE